MSKSKLNLPRYNMSYFLLSFFLSLNTIIFSQTHWVAARDIDNGPLEFIKPDGTLAFILSSQEIPQLIKSVDPFGIGNFNTVDFSGGVIIVINSGKAYFINQKGKKVLDIGNNIRFATPLINGFFMVYRRVNNGSVITYYEKDGKIAFWGKEFWEATPFENGKAIVQEYNPKENWSEQTSDFQIIDTKGKSLLNISKTLYPNKIRNMGPYNFGLIPFYTRDNQTIHFDIETFKIETKYRDNFPKDSSIMKKLKVLADKKGVKLNIEPIEKFCARTGIAKDSVKYGNLLLGKNYGYLIQIEKSDLTLKEHSQRLNEKNPRTEIFNVDDISILYEDEEYKGYNDGYISTSFKKNGETFYRFRKIESLEIIGETSKLPHYIQDGYFVYGKKPGILNTIAPIIKNSKGVDIWPRNGSRKLKATEIEEILKNPNQVISINLKSFNDDIEKINFPILPEVYEIHIHESNLNNLSSIIDKCPKLSRLYLSNCPNLHTIVSSNKKTNLDFILVSECPEIENSIEGIIRLSPKLNSIRGIYKNELIKKYPKITFEDLLSEVK